MIATLHDGTTYECRHPWPDSSRATVLQEGEYSFTVFLPAPPNVNLRDRHTLTPKGFVYQRPEFAVTGGGQSLEKAEDAAWKNYQTVLNCDHDFHRYTLSDGKTLHPDGDGGCFKCGIMAARYFQDERLYHAEQIAHRVHAGVSRKWAKLPYICHPQAVYYKAIFHLPDVVVGCAAWLHDTLEDCDPAQRDTVAQEIREKCGEDVLQLVGELTNPSKGSTLSRAERKRMDRDHLAVVSREAKILKLVDRTENLRDVSCCPDKNFVRLYFEESRLLFDALKDALPADHELVVNFQRVLNEPQVEKSKD